MPQTNLLIGEKLSAVGLGDAPATPSRNCPSLKNAGNSFLYHLPWWLAFMRCNLLCV